MPLSPSEADKLIAGVLKRLGEENCLLERCLGRILREDIKAQRDFPPFDRATMDGFALRAGDGAACAGRFEVTGFAPAGAAGMTLPERTGACIEIGTGAVLPSGADCVVPYERAARIAGGSLVSVDPLALARGNCIHRRGGDRKAGALLVRKGFRLGASETAMAAACGMKELKVTRRPGITLLMTGDELAERGAQAASWQIWSSNDIALRLSLEAAGFPVREVLAVRDDEALLEKALCAVFERGDWVVSCGGSSKGRLDLLPSVVKKLRCTPLFEGVAQKPGGPFSFFLGPVGQPIFVLPGSPVSSYVCLHRYVLPGLLAASGAKAPLTHRIRVPMTGTEPGDVTRFIPVRLSRDWNAAKVSLVRANASGDFASLVETDGFIELAAGGGKGWGREIGVDFWPWK